MAYRLSLAKIWYLIYQLQLSQTISNIRYNTTADIRYMIFYRYSTFADIRYLYWLNGSFRGPCNAMNMHSTSVWAIPISDICKKCQYISFSNMPYLHSSDGILGIQWMIYWLECISFLLWYFQHYIYALFLHTKITVICGLFSFWQTNLNAILQGYKYIQFVFIPLCQNILCGVYQKQLDASKRWRATYYETFLSCLNTLSNSYITFSYDGYAAQMCVFRKHAGWRSRERTSQ